MKFTSLPKKLLLSGMSAAMVVAFAPAVAMANVSDTPNSSTTTQPAPAANDVAQLSWQVKSGNTTTTNTKMFKSDATTTDDDALQAAVDEAAVTTGQNVTVTLYKDVVANGITDASGLYYYAANTNDEGIVLTGNGYTVNLNNHSITNSKGQRAVTVGNATLNRKGGAQEVSETVYAHPQKLSAAANQAYRQADNNKVTGQTLKTVKANGDANYYQWNDGAKKWDVVKDAGFIKDNQDKVYQKYDVTYDKTVANDSKKVTAGTVTVKGGKIESVNDESAVKVNKGTLTIDGTTVQSSKANDTITNKSTIVLQGGATVQNTFNGDTNSDGVADENDNSDNIAGIDGGTVETPKTADPYQSVAKVNVALTNGQGQDVAGIVAEKVTTQSTIDVTATAQAGTYKKAKAGQTDPYWGVIGNDAPTIAADGSTTYAILSENAYLGYGNYTADYALATGNYNADSYVRYGTYNGYVTEFGEENFGLKDADAKDAAYGVNISGGKFKYDPSATIKDGKEFLQYANHLKNALAPRQEYKVSEVHDGYYYVYRVGQAKDVIYQLYNGQKVDEGDYMTVSVPEGAKNAKGTAYKNDLNAYVQDGYLDNATKNLVFTATGKKGEVATSLNDGNDQTADFGLVQPTLDVQLTAKYGTPTEAAAKEGKYDAAFKALSDQAKADSKTVQGVYNVSGEQQYGVKNKKPVYTAPISDLEKAPVALTASLVQANGNAKVYTLAANGATAFDGTVVTPAAVNNTPYSTATWNVSKLGTDFGVLVDTTESRSAAQVKAVVEAIATIPTDAVTADNYENVQNAIDAAKAAYAGLNADQKSKVTNYADIAAAQARVKTYTDKVAADKAAADKAAADAKAQAEQQAAIQKAVDTAKAQKVSGLKVKAGKKKATVSWKKASGYKYQVKYRQKNSSKTSDFKYKKTSKTKVTLKGLKKGKYYNFKVRTYKTVNGKTVYGKYTSIVTAKIK